MDLGIRGKVALVTGGNRGIGKAAATELAKEGCHISITGRNEADLAAAEKCGFDYRIGGFLFLVPFVE